RPPPSFVSAPVDHRAARAARSDLHFWMIGLYQWPRLALCYTTRGPEQGGANDMTTSKAATPSRPAANGVDTSKFICNVVPSVDTESDWRFADSIASGAADAPAVLPPSVDLRAPWWSINDQERTGSCVGWATADGLARYHMVKAGRIGQGDLLSPRYVW